MIPKGSVFKFVNIEDDFSIANISNRELICKYFNGFNDPYEGHYGISTEWPSPYRETSKLKSLIGRISPEKKDINTASIDHMRAFIELNGDMSDITQGVLDDITKKIRVCSFTRSWSHILMWAHYAHGGRGVVLVFDQEALCKSNVVREKTGKYKLNLDQVLLNWVQYKSSPPIINSVDVYEAIKTKNEKLISKIDNELRTKCTLTKSRYWKYEQESRLLLRLNLDIDKEPVIYKYPEDALIGVIMGNKCEDESYISVSNSLDKNIPIYLAKQSPDRYKYVIENSYMSEDIKSGKVIIKKKIE